MNRFVFNRAALLVMGLTLTLSCQGAGMQAAYADSSWGEILKPLVRDILIPGASAVAKKVAKKMDIKTGTTQSTETNSADSSSPEVVIITPDGNSDTTTPTQDGPEVSKPYAITQASESTDDSPPPPPPPPRESP